MGHRVCLMQAHHCKHGALVSFADGVGDFLQAGELSDLQHVGETGGALTAGGWAPCPGPRSRGT